MNDLLNIKPNELIDDFFNRVYKHKKIEKEQLKELSKRLMKSDISGYTLQKLWYTSLLNENPDYSVYDEDIYISDLWACWVLYSRQYLRNIKNPKSNIPPMEEIKKIVDIGCGFGYTTTALKQMFPDAEVIGTNLSDTTQIEVAKELGKEHGFEVISEYNEIGGNVDMVFASEYFEHFYKPIEHLHEVIRFTETKSFFIANSFGTKSVGHFDTYNIGGMDIDGKKVSRLFNKELRKYGYKNIKTKIWNNKPSYWKIDT
jgi:2-polyprenyl-3-methyl-5-hydroxy-6-metoxy-1,4-benzoquinol methylase